MKKNQNKCKQLFYILIVLIVLGLCTSCSCSRKNNTSDEKKDQSSENKTNSAYYLSDDEVTGIQNNAVVFYELAYKGEYDQLKALMTDEYAEKFDNIRKNGQNDESNDGTYKLLILNQLTEVSSPIEIGNPVMLSNENQYSVKLTLNDQQSAYVCFQKMGDEYKIYNFDLDIVSSGKGGHMGSGYQK